jgi:integrase
MRKVGLHGVSLHSLRHSHATSLLSKGVPIAVVSARLGHADQNITLPIYSHALPADTKAAAKGLERRDGGHYFGGASGWGGADVS